MNKFTIKFMSADGGANYPHIFVLLQEVWRGILIGGLLGMFMSGIYLFIAPSQFEATAIITMGRIPPQGINIEEPLALINRMRSPTSMSEIVIQECGLNQSGNPADQLTKIIKLSIPRGIANTVELRAAGSTPNSAHACAESVFNIISTTQEQMISDNIKNQLSRNKARIKKLDERLEQDKSLLIRAENVGNNLSSLYFDLISDMRKLEDERENLIKMTDLESGYKTGLQSPIFTPIAAVYPRKSVTLGVGLFLGMLIGFLIEFLKKIITKYRGYPHQEF